ncbi:MAG TPA: lactonase family protein [Chitinophagaceae bacterium]
MKITILFLLLIAMVSSFAQNEPYLLVGTYTSGSSEGIYVFKFNSDSGTFKPVSTTKTSNPSFLAVSSDQRYVYAVNENADSTMHTTGGSVAAFSFDKQSGKLTAINKQYSGGKHPCYVAIDKTGKWVFAGNYTSGSLALLKVQQDGGLEPPAQVIEHTGYSVNEERQTSPHVHATVVSPDNKFLFVPDLGIDKLMIYSFDAKKGTLSPAKVPFQMTEAGAGPRHFDFHPNGRYAYLMEELSGSISVYAYKKGELSLLQNISALPHDFNGDIGSADIHVSPDGKFLYASNRGESNTIAIFSINPSNGQLFPVGHQSTLGKTPRNFNFDPSGNFLLVANQNSDEIVIFKRNKQTGLLTDTGKRIPVSKPVCIKWVKH